jgi:hypothetical protein
VRRKRRRLERERSALAVAQQPAQAGGGMGGEVIHHPMLASPALLSGETSAVHGMALDATPPLYFGDGAGRERRSSIGDVRALSQNGDAQSATGTAAVANGTQLPSAPSASGADHAAGITSESLQDR